MLQQICDQTMYDLLYEARGDLLDMRAIAAINERPFYLGKELGSIKDQVSLIERITVDAQNAWFELGDFTQPVQLAQDPRERNACLEFGSDEWYDNIKPIQF